MRRPVLIAAAAIFLITHSSNLQVPLYNTYAQLAGYGSGISALAFSTYVAGLLPTLMPTLILLAAFRIGWDVKMSSWLAYWSLRSPAF
jgi:hypothetical protein